MECDRRRDVFHLWVGAGDARPAQSLVKRPGRPRRSSGFTLIELLVVVAIISLLVSILLPSLHKAKELARTVICQSNLKGIGIGLTLYGEDWDLRLPYGSCFWQYSDEAWEPALCPYFGITEDQWGAPDYREWISDTRYDTIYVCPSNEGVEGQTLGSNFFIVMRFSGYPPGHMLLPWYPNERSRLDETAPSTFLITDTNAAGAGSPKIWGFDYDADGDGIDDSDLSLYGGNKHYNGAAPNRHRNGANYLFGDGSADWVSMKDWETNAGELWGPWGHEVGV